MTNTEKEEEGRVHNFPQAKQREKANDAVV
jgi:hypothetical protein